MLSSIEEKRLQLSKKTTAKKKSLLGQFLTPERTATFMAGLFRDGKGVCRLLDAGAGIGSLSVSFLERWRNGGFHFSRVELDAFELDATLIVDLKHMINKYADRGDLFCNVFEEDFIHIAADTLSGSFFSKPLNQYTHVILNPPYKKINSRSAHRQALRRVGIETVNLYSAFVALAIALTKPNGQIVAIIPRSFCNGPYYRPFRDLILEKTAICHVHLFESRSRAFKEDKVLQENIIIKLERGAKQGPVNVSTSTDNSFSDILQNEYPFDRIVFNEDPERFIHVPTSPGKNIIEQSSEIRFKLDDIGLQVSTGPVVDFRLKEHLCNMPIPGTVPLLYPGHFSVEGIKWPIENTKKPNAIIRNEDTEKWLYPIGFYCIVRRFSSKEEKRWIFASIVDPNILGDAQLIGLENHLNVFHADKNGLSEALAKGLAVYLNTTAVDDYFRRFNGHTQVNATDLRLMKYPSRETLTHFGNWAIEQDNLTQDQIDAKLGTLLE